MIKHSDPNSPSGFRYELEQSDMDEGRTVLLGTGPIAGVFSVANGEAAYDTTEEMIAVKPEHHAEMLHLIHKAHHAAGRYLEAPLPSVKDYQKHIDDAQAAVDAVTKAAENGDADDASSARRR